MNSAPVFDTIVGWDTAQWYSMAVAKKQIAKGRQQSIWIGVFAQR